MGLHIFKTRSGSKGLGLADLPRRRNPGGGCKSPARRFYLESPLLGQQFACLKHLLGAGAFLGLVLGDKASGKTALMRRLIRSDRRCWRRARLHINSRRSERLSLSNLEGRMVFMMADEKGLPAMLCDDAHQLCWSELKFIFDCIWPGCGRGRLKGAILFARPSIRSHFRRLMEMAPPRAFVRRIDLSPFTEAQTAAYLRTITDKNGLLFSRRQARRIHRLSGGLPGLIRQVSSEKLRKTT